jgi:hypothetical protein
MPGAGSGSACAPSDWAPSSRKAAVNESAGDERLVTDEHILVGVVVVAMVGMVVAGMWRMWFPGVSLRGLMMIDGFYL